MKQYVSPLEKPQAELTSDFDSARVRLTVPEGIELSFHVATFGDRLRVTLVDFGVLTIAQLLVGYFTVQLLGALFPSDILRIGLGTAIAVLSITVVYAPLCQRFLYGRTLGMFLNGVRVVRTDGGLLCAKDAVLRSSFGLPLYILPIGVIIMAHRIWPAHYGWVIAATIAVTMAYMLVTLVSPLQQGLSDLIMQTMLVKETRPRPYARVPESSHSGLHHFDSAQLALYGTYELHVLEELLSNPDQLQGELLVIAASAISQKCAIAWEQITDPRAFVTDFYLALRRDLSAAMSAGRVRHRKQVRGIQR